MSRDMDLLIPEFRDKAMRLLEECRFSGYEMRPFYTVRTPFEQAKLWRQSRTYEQIHKKINELRIEKCEFLAHCIESVGPQHGQHVTNAIPGLSWHQWGEAMDCFWKRRGKAEWSTDIMENGNNGYQLYTEKAISMDLNPGGSWSRFKDYPHVQLRGYSSPKIIYSMSEIDAEMKRMYDK